MIFFKYDGGLKVVPYSIKNCFDRKKILEINDLRNKKDSLFVN